MAFFVLKHTSGRDDIKYWSVLQPQEFSSVGLIGDDSESYPESSDSSGDSEKSSQTRIPFKSKQADKCFNVGSFKILFKPIFSESLT